MAGFTNINDRRSARRRYLTPRPSSDGSGISQADQQQIRWHYTGILIGIPAIPALVNYIAAYIAVSRPVARRL